MANKSLPPGQQPRSDFPRFGLPKYADRIPADTTTVDLALRGDAVRERSITASDLDKIERVEQISDFHCVTTWSHLGVRWGGYRFRHVYDAFIKPSLIQTDLPALLVFRCRDGYRTGLPLEDLLAADVLLANTLNGSPLSVEHGAPLRVVAPSHYGYKNAKHIKGIDVWTSTRRYRKRGVGHYIDHPRARVAQEERGRIIPGWILRRVYRPAIEKTVQQFRKGMETTSLG